MNEKLRLIKNTGLIALGNSGVKVISFLLLPLYTSILSTSEYGTYDYIVVISSFLLPIFTLSITDAMFRFIIETGNHGEKFKTIITNSFFIVISGDLLLFITLYIIQFFYTFSNWKYIWIYVSANSIYLFSIELLRGLGMIKEYAIISSGKNLLIVILNVITILVFRKGIYGLIFSMCFSEIMAFIIVFFVVRFFKHINFKLLRRDVVKDLLCYSVPLIPNGICLTLITVSDRIFITNILGTSENGIYSVSNKFPNIIETVYHYFYSAWTESASRVIKKGVEESKSFYITLYTQLDRLVFSVIMLLTSGMPILFRIFIRGDYINGFDYIPLLMFSMYFFCMSNYYTGIFTALKQTKAIATTTMIAAVINIIINFSLIKIIGLWAAAWSTFFSNLVLFIMRRYILRDKINVKINLRELLFKVCLVIIVMILYSYNNWLYTSISISVVVIYTLSTNYLLIKKIFSVIKEKIQRTI